MAIPAKDVRKAAPRGVDPILSHTHLDKAGPWLRTMLGLALIAFTGYTTITGVGVDFAPLLEGAPPVVWLAAGLGVAVLLSLGEWLTSESVPLVYSILLLIDARYTQWQIGPKVDALAKYHLQDYPWYLTAGVSLVVSWGLAIVVARYGEILLFGRRKKE